MRHIETDAVSARYREAAVDVKKRRLLVTNFSGTAQEADLSEPANCRGFGRIRHFRRETSPGWPENPLPLDPACRRLGLALVDVLRAQAFQNAVCNWRCWYCFVPFDLLAANKRHSAWLSPSELTELYLDQQDPPVVIDLTGGQPDLVPEWVPWMMRELRSKALDHRVYVWSDDNLSNDYFWRFLTPADIELVATYPNYGRVGCFKGFNQQSFAFNTMAAPSMFDRQFELMSRLVELGVDVYAYVTLTTPTNERVADDMARFVDRLQAIDPNLPLRTIPLEIRIFSPVRNRLTTIRKTAMENQQLAVVAWQRELDRRFSNRQLEPFAYVRPKTLG